MNVKKLRKGNEFYFLYSEKRNTFLDPVGYFGRAYNLKENPSNLEFNLAGFEMYVPAIDLCFEDELLIKEKVPHIVLPNKEAPYAIIQTQDHTMTKEIDYARNIKDFALMIRNRGFNPSPGLYYEMTDILNKLKLTHKLIN
jgi:hypothetical protein